MPLASSVVGLLPCKAVGFASQGIGSIASKAINVALGIPVREARSTDMVVATINTSPDKNLVLGRVVLTTGLIQFTIENTGGAGSTGGTLTVAFILFDGPVR